MKYIINLILLSLICSAPITIEAKSYPASSSSTTTTFYSVPQQLQPTVAKMLKLPEVRELLKTVNQEGPVRIMIDSDSSSQFDAMWDGNERVIRLNASRHKNEGTWICSILFELHNASTSQYMNRLYQAAAENRMAKDQWVEAMERMEHGNARRTCELIEKGIATGIYPPETRWSIFNSFDDHYRLQQVTGHSTWLANSYEQTNSSSVHQPYRGTIPNLNAMTAEDIADFQNYLVIKNDLENGKNPSTSKDWLKKELSRLQACSAGKMRQGCYRTKEKMRLLDLAFKGSVEFDRLKMSGRES